MAVYNLKPTVMEFFDVYDENNNPLNHTKERRKVHQDGDWHRTSQVWVMNDKKEILCNLRSRSKDLFPNYWDLSIGGHVSAGDTYEETAKRELWEELGLKTIDIELKFLSQEKVDGIDLKNNLIDREHARLFLYLTSKQVNEFTIQEEEIEKIEYFSIEKLLEIVRTQEASTFKVVPIKKHFIKILNTLKVFSAEK